MSTGSKLPRLTVPFLAAVVWAALAVGGCGPRVSEASGEGLDASIRALPDAGGTPWDDEVKRLLLERHDGDRSGAIDSAAELDAIPCEVWVAIDAAIADAGRWRGLRRTYGFPEGYIWVGHVIGVAEKVRAEADAALDRCGIAER